MFKKVIISAPTASVKNYCVKEWLLNINNFTYPNFEVVLVDNTKDNGENVKYLESLASELVLKYDFAVVRPEFENSDAELIERMCDSHNMSRKLAIESGYQYLFHLETDVFPPEDVIERLIFNHKRVCGGLYYRDAGINRKLMIQQSIFRAHDNAFAKNMAPDEDATFIDGTVKKVSHVGLGCVMIHREVFEKIPFRFQKNSDASVDSWFMADCLKNKVNIYADTSIICRHEDSPEVWSNIVIDKIANASDIRK